ncbi:MAG: Cytochrome bd-I ubiquinol oxidase subunit 1 [Verrucomicrobiae bacterium]|nr:Cytochrome bd-I ubiquinol oxidase subunit 1 [Verrucomicrobiae bacterium]
MNLDVVELARIQFALTIMFHYIFPPVSIGLGGLLVSLEWKYLRTRDRQYEVAAKFWTKIFAIIFAIGVATGITMEFQFGTNWATYSRYVGDVFGSALAAEGIFAFFLESGFLAVLVFGWDKVSPRLHFFATCMVALGAIFSSVWIVVANSWQQTPAGFHIVNGRAEITDFWAMVFNPSSVHRLVHVWIGAYIVGGFFVMSIAAYYLLKNRHLEFARKSFCAALTIATLGSLAAVVSGDLQGRNVAQTQPAKLAAMEGHFKTDGPTPLYLYGFPDETTQEVKGGFAIPGLLSLMVHGDRHKPVTGLDQFPREDWPPVALTFHTFHWMVMLGILFIGLTLLANFYRWRGTLFEKRWLLWIFVWVVPLPFAANQLGWIAAEVGRQPWVVYGLLRTSDAVSKSVSAGQVLGSIIMFSVIYALLFAAFLYILNSKIQHGPDEVPAAGGK